MLSETDRNADLLSRAIRGGAVLISAKLGVQALQWLVTIVTMRLLSPADFGLAATALLVTGIAELIADVGLSRALVNSRDASERSTNAAFTVSLVTALLLYGLIWWAAPALSSRLASPGLEPVLRAMGLIVLFVPIQVVGNAALERDLNFPAQSVIHAVMSLVQCVVVLVLAWGGYGVWALVATMLSARAVQALALRWTMQQSLRFALPDSDTRAMLGYGTTISATSLLWYVYSSADSAIIAGLLGPVTLGFYSVMMQLVSIPADKLSAAINQIAFATFSKLQNEPEKLRRWFARLLVLRAAIAWPVLIGLAVVADDAIPFALGPKWVPGIQLVRLLAPAGALILFATSFAPLFNAVGRPDLSLKYTTSCVVVMPIAFIVAGKLWGVVGICAVWLTVYPLLVAGMVHLTRHVTGLGLVDVANLHSPLLVATGLMAVCVGWCSHFMPSDLVHWQRLLVLCPVGALVYSAGLFATARRTIVADAYDLLRQMMPGRLHASGPADEPIGMDTGQHASQVAVPPQVSPLASPLVSPLVSPLARTSDPA